MTFQDWWDANGREFPRMVGAMSPRDLARDCWKAAQEQMPKTDAASHRNRELRGRIAALETAGNVLSQHLRNCGGCIGCDEAIEAWRKTREP